MATEGILTLESPPRLSFSENVNLDAKFTGDGWERNDGFRPVEAAGSIDFNFSAIFPSSNSTDSSDADELFSDGKLLPFFKTTTTTVPTATTENNSSGPQLPRSISDHGGTLDAISESAADSGGREGHRRHKSRHSIWRFGRSSSVGSVAPTGPILPYFAPLHRSKSTGSFFPTPPLAAVKKASSSSSSKKFAVDPNQRKTYYYSGSKRGSHRSAGGGVRITPVLNVPAPPMVYRGGSGSGSSSAAVSSLFYYLLCSCGGEERFEEAESAQCNPAKTERSGTEPVSFVA